MVHEPTQPPPPPSAQASRDKPHMINGVPESFENYHFLVTTDARGRSSLAEEQSKISFSFATSVQWPAMGKYVRISCRFSPKFSSSIGHVLQLNKLERKV